MKYKFLRDLARFVPVLTQAQLVRHYFAGNLSSFKQALRAAEAKGFVRASVEVVRGRETPSPIAVLSAGTPLPSGEAIAYSASQRWSNTLEPTLVIRGTAKLASLHGGETKDILTAHLSHEIALADVFLKKRQDEPRFEWELLSSRPGVVSADALAVGVMIELVGRYSGSKVAGKLQLAAQSKLELW